MQPEEVRTIALDKLLPLIRQECEKQGVTLDGLELSPGGILSVRLSALGIHGVWQAVSPREIKLNAGDDDRLATLARSRVEHWRRSFEWWLKEHGPDGGKDAA